MCGESFYMNMLASRWAEAVLFGFYAVLFSGCVYVHMSKRADKRLLWTAILIFALASTQAILDFVMVLLAPDFVANTECIDGACVSCFGADPERLQQVNIFSRLQLVSQTVFVINQLVADGLMTYRAYIIWNRNYKVALTPIFLMFVAAACGFAQIDFNAKMYFIRLEAPATDTVPPPNWFHFSTESTRFDYSFFGISLGTNVFITGLIAYRVWCSSRQPRTDKNKKSDSLYHLILTVIVESGVIYTACLAFCFIPTDDAGIAAAAVGQIVGIVPTVILTRVALRKSVENGGSAVANVVHTVSGAIASHAIEFHTPTLHSDQETSVRGRGQLSEKEEREEKSVASLREIS
ncbi:hypothetical protein JAAARDRAFT_40527 [Jaapia argillacea MUCL 33604]|uniref:Uncharacterized protein n=1 Tax=Jaapia argillacea MUCL 33604 TaxID=933084 RepID=A0A067PM38_9AGAM|nr:hypothetical protein JAAARDRAFT_40527 [Jaapia argillacea MUCL 33604]